MRLESARHGRTVSAGSAQLCNKNRSEAMLCDGSKQRKGLGSAVLDQVGGRSLLGQNRGAPASSRICRCSGRRKRPHARVAANACCRATGGPPRSSPRRNTEQCRTKSQARHGVVTSAHRHRCRNRCSDATHAPPTKRRKLCVRLGCHCRQCLVTDLRKFTSLPSHFDVFFRCLSTGGSQAKSARAHTQRRTNFFAKPPPPSSVAFCVNMGGCRR